ncbi:MAG: nuclear transport factor 2 family protein [Burkholderiales bacterium]|nr:MAG: nuclear transport factor 2 family protein [Burkholderiales bacterium]
MNDSPTSLTPADAGAIVNEFLRLSMIPDPESAARYTSADLKLTFTGKRAMRQPADATRFNASRYKLVRKNIERTDVVIPSPEEATRGETIVYSIGTLYGEWLDGTPFEGNRYVDRFVVKDGLITKMDVWNDSAEWMMVRAGLATL